MNGDLSLLDAAFAYAARSWHVIPLHDISDGACSCQDGALCSTPGKHPRISKWPERASVDPAVIASWWRRWPYANVGIVTGTRSKLIVLDVDPRHGGDDTLAAFEGEHGKLPDSVVVLTGGGGLHYYFAHPSFRVDSRVIAPGLELKAEGTFVVAPPSLTGEKPE